MKRRVSFIKTFICMSLCVLLLSFFSIISMAETTSFANDTEGDTAADIISTEEETTIPEEEPSAIEQFFEKLKNDLYRTFIKDSRYKHITNGLIVTLEITFVALLIGLALGFVIAIICATNTKNGTLKIPALICKAYLTIFRGTPVIVQLLIIYYLWLGKFGWGETYVAMIAFGLNSAAYIAEIVRSGIMSIDNGQFEAGRSLGFNYVQTMLHIVLPQAFKNVLPALANEFISLLKETSVASFIAVKDMMKGANVIVGVTYNMVIPYLTVALIYLVMVIILTKLVSLLERRLRNSEH